MEDLAARIVLFVVMAGSGLLLLWAARAAASGRLRRNGIAGIRTPSTMASDEAWLAAHRRAERPSVLAAVTSIASGILALVLPAPAPVLAGVVIVACVVMLGFVLWGARVGGLAAREAVQSGGPVGPSGPDGPDGHGGLDDPSGR